MGFFSWDCEKCGKSIKAPYNLPTPIAWQNNCVAICKNGTVIKGPYDGYGRIAGAELVEQKPTMYHQRCWDGDETYKGESHWSHDQGYFYDYPEKKNRTAAKHKAGTAKKGARKDEGKNKG